MRLSLVLLVLSLMFSGYFTAAHAFEEVLCQESAGEIQNTEAKSVHCQSDASSTDIEKADHGSKAGCSDCHHCCLSSAITPADNVGAVPVYFDVALQIHHDTRDGDVVSQLRRPPKTLV